MLLFLKKLIIPFFIPIFTYLHADVERHIAGRLPKKMVYTCVSYVLNLVSYV